MTAPTPTKMCRFCGRRPEAPGGNGRCAPCAASQDAIDRQIRRQYDPSATPSLPFGKAQRKHPKP